MCVMITLEEVKDLGNGYSYESSDWSVGQFIKKENVVNMKVDHTSVVNLAMQRQLFLIYWYIYS